MTRTNEHGQPIGDALDWTAREEPSPVTLTGRHVVVEPVAERHAVDLHAALCGPDDASLWTYRPDDAPGDESAMRARCRQWAAQPGWWTFALVPRGSGRAAGLASLLRVDAAQGSAEVGAILFGRSLQRTPAATESIVLLAAHLFDDLGYRRLEWKLDSLNAPSAAAARRLGFTYEGRFRKAVVYQGRSRDTDWFAMTDDDWRALRPAYDAWLDPANLDDDGRQRSRLSDLTASALPRP
ncbi:GNAT family protein [Nocardioides aestuarii]|uniref:GNAT family protein n=1 Tax=Nocardioides aestuarii TaxID=252231 RepID=A0ABW4TFQ0_9ACTN